MRNTVTIFGIIALVLMSVLFTSCPENFDFDTRPPPETREFVPVQEITGIPTASLPYLEIILAGTVVPEDATYKRIMWSIKEDGGTVAALERRNRLSAEEYGTVTVTALIENGSAEGEDYTQDFEIVISATP